jgi:hypothetical protein
MGYMVAAHQTTAATALPSTGGGVGQGGQVPFPGFECLLQVSTGRCVGHLQVCMNSCTMRSECNGVYVISHMLLSMRTQ